MKRETPPGDLPRWVTRALAGRSPAETSDHPDDTTLAAYIDGALDRQRRRGIETHLAECATCRELALVASGAASEVGGLVGVPKRDRFVGWFAPRAAWMAAAVLTLLIAAPIALWLRSSQIGHLASLGVERSEITSAGADLVADARLLARGRLGPAPGLSTLTSTDGASAFRSSGRLRPEPLLPRWSATLSRRPPLDLVAPALVEELELLLIDGNDQLVGAARLAPAGDGSPRPRRLEFPAELPDLEEGGVYAWRISGRIGSEWVASDFAPFRVLAPEEREKLESKLQRAANDPFLRATAYLSAGVDREGLVELAAVASTVEDREHLAELVAAVYRRQHLPPDLATREKARLLTRVVR